MACLRMQTDPNQRESQPIIDSNILEEFSDSGEFSVTADQWIDLEEVGQRRFKARSEEEEELMKMPILPDLLPLGAALASIGAVLTASLTTDLVPQSFPLYFAFSMGYLSIIFEEKVRLNKSGSALLMGIVCWSLVGHASGLPTEAVLERLNESLAAVSQIFFFLLGAMAIVETVDAHQGFAVVTDQASSLLFPRCLHHIHNRTGTRVRTGGKLQSPVMAFQH